MTEINWGAFNNYPDAGQAFIKGMEQGRARRVESLTGQALNALMTDPNSAGQQIGELAKIAPQNALALVQFQQKQQDRQRDVRFRDAQADYMGTFAPPSRGGNPSSVSGSAVNALAPFATGQAPVGTVGADGGPPIGAAPPPPANWQQNLGPATVAALSSPGANGMTDSNMPVTPYMGGSPLQPIDPRADLGIGAGAQQNGQSLIAGAAPASQQGVTTDIAAIAQTASGDTPMPANIARAAQSPNMEARNRAFTEMAKIDPMAAMKIDSEMRDAMLDRLEDADKAYRLAVARLPRVTDEASYQQTLSEVEGLLTPLGMNIRDTVPANYPGPEGIRQLHMQALDAQQQLAAMDRRFSAEARANDIDADNARQDRNTDSIIADRGARTGIARERAATADRREARIGSGGGGRKTRKAGGGSASEPSAVNPATGERIVFRGGKWVPAK